MRMWRVQVAAQEQEHRARVSCQSLTTMGLRGIKSVLGTRVQ